MPLAERTLELLIDIANGLAHAHANGIVHRDIKPANLLLSGAPALPVIADFGICYVVDGDRMTLTDEAVGPRLFVAPELEDGRAEQVSARSDVYTLGKLLYWLLKGRFGEAIIKMLSNPNPKVAAPLNLGR